MEYINVKNYEHKKIVREWEKSETVPNMAISLKEILKRAIKGREVLYTENQE